MPAPMPTRVIWKTPGAIVDQDGNVYLNSSTRHHIFKRTEVKLSATDLALLKKPSANSVPEDQVLRNPSSKYDAMRPAAVASWISFWKKSQTGLNGECEHGAFQG